MFSLKRFLREKSKVKNKRGVHIWVSWILLLVFALVLSVMMYNWMYGFSEKSVKELETRTYKAESCDDIAISITGICQNSQTLYMNITNNQNIIIKQVIFRLYDVYDTPETKRKNITLRPGRGESIEVLKQGHLSRVELIPITQKGDEFIICPDRMVSDEDIGFC